MKQQKLLTYYFLLLLILCSWTDPVNTPNLILRLIFLGLAFVPVGIKYTTYLPHVLIGFTAIFMYATPTSYLPTQYYYYTSLVIIFAVLKKRFPPHLYISPLFILLAIYVVLIDSITNLSIENIGYSMVTMIVTMLFVRMDTDYNRLYVSVFAITTLTISYVFFIRGDNFIVEIQGLERVMFTDPNYMGCVAGFGVLISYSSLVTKTFSGKFAKIFCLVTIVIGFILLLENASRGAFLSTSLSIFVLTILSKLSLRKKIYFLLAITVMIIVMYNFELFDKLSQRVSSDDDSGSGRLNIWVDKLYYFFQLPFYDILLGVGNKGGFMLGSKPSGYGFHNDFVAFFVDYGVVGLCLFLAFLIYPLYMSLKRRSNIGVTLSFVIFMILSSATLEPFSSGRLTFYYIYMYTFIMATKKLNTRYITNEKNSALR